MHLHPFGSPNHVTSPSACTAKSMHYNLASTNKTKFRPSLKLDGTLLSILTVKLAKSEHCHKYDPPLSVLKYAKRLQVITTKHTVARIKAVARYIAIEYLVIL